MLTGPDREKLRQAFADIIDGKVVKRSVHELAWSSRLVVDEFVQVLQEKGYLACPLQEIEVRPGERIPAFHVDGSTAYFGWVFWEKFSERKMRKLFGSVVRNEKGDWAVQIAGNRTTVIYANVGLKSEMDIDKPSGF